MSDKLFPTDITDGSLSDISNILKLLGDNGSIPVNIPYEVLAAAIKTYVEQNSTVIAGLVNNILVVKTYTDGGIIYIDKSKKILHANLFLAGNTQSGGVSVATITGFTPPSSNRDISFPAVYSDGTVGYGILRVHSTGEIKVYAHKTGTMVNVSVTGECYIG